MIYAGQTKEILWSSGTWLILDIGFSSKSRSCGLLLNDYKPNIYQFGEAVSEVIKVSRNNKILNLVIEAPLSIAFNKDHNPKHRKIDKKDSQMRYWYLGAGCLVMVATLHLLRRLVNSKPKTTIRLFEGFVSYKEKGSKPDHLKDVCLLREVIKKPNQEFIYDETRLLDSEDDILESAFKVAGMDFGIPPVIEVR